MQYIATLIVVILSYTAPLAHADIEPDKKLHFVTSYAIDATLTHVLRKTKHPLLYANCLTLLAGVAKEYTDKKFDNGDMVANGLGVLTYSIVHITLEF